MPKSKGILDEDTFLLFPDNEARHFGVYPQSYYEIPIVKGVVNHLRRWPYDLLLAFLAACLIIGSLMLLIFVTVIICFPNVVTNRTVEGTNVYFLKLENRTWSTMEFCYVETAARRHPRLNVYLINLSSHETSDKNWETTLEASNHDLNISRSGKEVNNTSKQSIEEQLRRRLVSKSTNIHSVDTTVDKLFKGTKLSKIAWNLTNHMLEIAAQAQLLWNVPGIAVKPSMYCNLKSMELFMCNGTIMDCPMDKQATIDQENNVLATGVPCQAFMGFLIQEMAKNSTDDGYKLQSTIHRYCPTDGHCPEIRHLHLKPECSSNDLDCPIVYSSSLIEKSDFRNLPM